MLVKGGPDNLWKWVGHQGKVCGHHTVLLTNPLPEALDKHDDVIKWKHFPRHWSFLRGIHRSPVNSLHKSQWRGALMFSLICAWINGCVNNREAGDLIHHRPHYDVIVMVCLFIVLYITISSHTSARSRISAYSRSAACSGSWHSHASTTTRLLNNIITVCLDLLSKWVPMAFFHLLL